MTRFDLMDALDPRKVAEVLKGATTYADLLSHMILTSVPIQMEAGHSFKVKRESSVNGVHTLIATDAFDGKSYRVTVEAVRDLPVRTLGGERVA